MLAFEYAKETVVPETLPKRPPRLGPCSSLICFGVGFGGVVVWRWVRRSICLVWGFLGGLFVRIVFVGGVGPRAKRWEGKGEGDVEEEVDVGGVWLELRRAGDGRTTREVARRRRTARGGRRGGRKDGEWTRRVCPLTESNDRLSPLSARRIGPCRRAGRAFAAGRARSRGVRRSGGGVETLPPPKKNRTSRKRMPHLLVALALGRRVALCMCVSGRWGRE